MMSNWIYIDTVNNIQIITDWECENKHEDEVYRFNIRLSDLAINEKLLTVLKLNRMFLNKKDSVKHFRVWLWSILKTKELTDDENLTICCFNKEITEQLINILQWQKEQKKVIQYVL